MVLEAIEVETGLCCKGSVDRWSTRLFCTGLSGWSLPARGCFWMVWTCLCKWMVVLCTACNDLVCVARRDVLCLVVLYLDLVIVCWILCGTLWIASCGCEWCRQNLPCVCMAWICIIDDVPFSDLNPWCETTELVYVDHNCGFCAAVCLVLINWNVSA